MKILEVLPGIRIVGLTLWLEREKTIVFSDTHLGYEEYLNKQGILVPRFQYKEIIEHLKEVLSETRPERIVINGDLKHEFGRISEQEWSEVMRFLDFLKGYEVILVRGNHDNILGPIASQLALNASAAKRAQGGGERMLHKRGPIPALVVPNFKLNKKLITHGNSIPDKKTLEEITSIIIGHDHPALGLREEGRVEKIKCFLTGKWKDKNLIAVPSFNFVTEGVDVLKETLLSPMLKNQNLDEFTAIGVEKKEILDFGKLSRIRQMNDED
jgi:putative SbcD/Mre11-related phosphoesterase